MRVIKNRSIIDDDWSLIRNIESSAPIPEGDVILPFVFWQTNRDQLLKTKKSHAIWIDGSIETESLLDDIDSFSIIALDFPIFKDGRSYSHARLLRERYNYKGELRAVGDVLQDQLFFMERCGIDSFQIRDDKDIEQALNGLKGFSVRYQAAADDTIPISERRKFK
ncbi:MAG: DUF934 domain-containing protein [Pseudomonadota bacterium]|nr:DUF934 domain-containing protein [Pseudomonadota bacterium]